jgi:mono/diheme cytochrome c family protein
MKCPRSHWSGMLAAGVALLMTSSVSAEAPTYHREVSRILQKNCQECHRPGQVAPFALLTYEQARKRADDLATVTHERKMPPWHASTTEGGPFRDPRVLSDTEIATIAAWAQAGAPEGDPKDAPPPLEFTSGWQLGEPDLVLTMRQPYELGPDGPDEHRVFVIPTGLIEGKWVAAIDYKPGNPRVVHHALGGFDTKKRGQILDKADPRPGYKVFGGFGFLPDGMLSGWSPGHKATVSPEGVGRYLPAGSDFLLQVHYHRDGKTETDSTQVGIYFARKPIDKEQRVAVVSPPPGPLLFIPKLRIPAGSSNHEVTGSLTLVDEDRHLIGITPHMHWLGKDFLLTASFPDGSKRTLIKIDRWDFNWQDLYDLAEPIAIPKGTRIDMFAHFDNSAANPTNPSNPPVNVGWGEQTTDEMCLGFLYMTRDDQHLGDRPPQKFRLKPAAPQ